MDFLKVMLAYMGATLVLAVESTCTPAVTPVPTPSPTPVATVVETVATPEPAETALPTVSVTPQPVNLLTPNPAYHNLGVGAKGQEVRKLQERLIELGYLPEGSADGAYGGQTRNAVRKFQYYNGLTQDGIAGRATQTNLFENPNIMPMPSDTPAPAEAETPAPTEKPTEEPTEEPTAEPTAEPTEEPTAEPTAEPTEEPTAEPTEEPTAEPTEEPTEEPTAEPTEEPTAEPTAEPTEEPEAGPEEIVENVDLDADLYDSLDGYAVLNDSGDPMQWIALEDGVSVIRYPRLQEKNGRIRISLDDMIQCVKEWILSDDGGNVILEAEGYTLVLCREDTGFIAILDGTQTEMDHLDFDFENEGHFIDAGFLTRALHGNFEWDSEERTLMLRIPVRDAAMGSD